MEQFILFLQQYYQLILLIAFAIAEICLLIFKKTVKVDSIKEKILEYLPLCIRVIEDSHIVGPELKKSSCISMLKKMLKYDSSYDGFVDLSIERILCTPEKKGKTDEK